MAIAHEVATRNALSDLIDDRVNLTSAGKIQISTTADDYVGAELLAEIDLNAGAFGASAAGIISMAGLPLNEPSAPNGGAALAFRIINGASLEILDGVVTIGGGGGDMIISGIDISSGEQVNVTAFTYECSL